MALVIIVPVTVKKLPAMNEKYAMAEELENNVLQNYVRASALAKEKKNPDDILKSTDNQDGDLKIELPASVGKSKQDISVETDYLTQTVYVKLKTEEENYFTNYSITGNSDYIDSMQYYKNDGAGVIAITTDKLYEITYPPAEEPEREIKNPEEIHPERKEDTPLPQNLGRGVAKFRGRGHKI